MITKQGSMQRHDTALTSDVCLCCCAVCAWVWSLPTAADGCFKLDLKGMLYQATVLPLAGTALVANIGPTEAKVGEACQLVRVPLS